MIKPIRSKNKLYRFCVLLLVLGGLTAYWKIEAKDAKEKMMMQKTISLWQAIDMLSKKIPFSKENVQSLFSTDLTEAKRTNHTLFLEGGGVYLENESNIEKIDLRLGFEKNDPGFLVLQISGACITLEQVRSHYSNIEMTGSPRGRSLDDTTSYTAPLPWGDLSFSFTERHPDCLSTIAFDPKKPN